jgi:hypothetical protein
VVQLQAGHLDAVEVGARDVGHGEALLGQGLDLAPLLPRVARHHHQHPVEAQRGSNVDGGHDVADVDGIERAPEDTDALRHAAERRAGGGHGADVAARAALFTLP